MVKRRNLRPDPRRAMADLLAKQAAQTKALGTVPTGVKDLGVTGDEVWTDPETGEESSVRELPALIDETAVAIDAAKKELEETRTDLEGAKGDLDAERAAREAALADAAAALAELEGKLDAGPSTADLDAIRSDLAAARAVADSATTAATEANTAAVAASQAALEAAGIAASKGRVIVSETEPTGADRTSSNIWIRPVPDDPDTEVQESAVTYVYLEASDEWQATTSSELAQAAQNALDAREAAQQAQQRADTAVSSAATAQSAAEAAQRTASQATLDAADAHNAAVAAADAAAQLSASADNLITWGKLDTKEIVNPSRTSWPTANDPAAAPPGSAYYLETVVTASQAGYTLPAIPVRDGRVYRFSYLIWTDAPTDNLTVTASLAQWRVDNGDGTWSQVNSSANWTNNFSPQVRTAGVSAPATGSWGEGYVTAEPFVSGKWRRVSETFPVPSQARLGKPVTHLIPRAYRWQAGSNGYGASGTSVAGERWRLADIRFEDVTDAVAAQQAAAAAQARADAAMTEAGKKATPEQVAAAEKAAKDAAAADATAKAAQAKADALAGAATDAASKAAAAQAAAEATAAADAKKKADQALADALAALETARGQITAEIQTSANGKNAITVSTSAPSSSKPGVVVGDTWWRVDSSGTIYGQWAWTGTAWAARTIRSEVIANLDVGKLVVTGSSRFTEAVADRLFTDIFAAHKVTASELTIAAIDGDGELVPNSVRGVHIQNGTVSANKIVIDGDPNDPDEVGLIARIASIMQLAVENLVVTEGATIDSAVILKLASEMVTAGVIRTAETGQRVVIDQGGVVLIGLDDDGFEYELVRLGPSGENLLTIGDTTVAPDGIATPSLEAGAVSVNGTSVQDMIGVAPQGVVAWAYSTSSAAWDGTGGELRRLQVDAVLQPGRRYSVTLDQHWARLRTGASGTTFVEFLRFEAGASASEATTSSAQLAVQRSFLQASTQSQTMPALVGWLDTADLNLAAERRVYFLFSTRSAGGRDARIEAASGETLRLTVRDEGPSVPSSGRSWMDQGTPSEGSADAPPAVPVKVVRTEKFAATRAESWDRGSSSFLSSKSGTVYQGKYPGVNAREGAWWFNALNGNLSGAKVKRVQIRFYVTHTYWGAGGTVDVRLHGKTGFTTGGLDTSIRTLKVKRNAQYSIDVPSQYLDGFRTGTWRGFGLSTSSTNLEYYVQARLANAEIWVTYER